MSGVFKKSYILTFAIGLVAGVLLGFATWGGAGDSGEFYGSDAVATERADRLAGDRSLAVDKNNRAISEHVDAVKRADTAVRAVDREVQQIEGIIDELKDSQQRTLADARELYSLLGGRAYGMEGRTD